MPDFLLLPYDLVQTQKHGPSPPNPKGPLEIRSEKRSLFDHPKISLLPFLNLSLNLLDAFARLVPSGHLIVGNPSFPEVPVPRHGGVPSFA